MIVYRATKQTFSTAPLIARLEAGLSRCLQSLHADHDVVRELLIDAGELEAGLTDALCVNEDSVSALSQRLRQISLALGHSLYLSWFRRVDEAREWLKHANNELAELSRSELPTTITISPPEGYAYYGLYPEMYLAAAQQFAQAVHPAQAVVIGLRSIGTSLSAVVAATLEQGGIETRSFTVRPRGHPFERQLIIAQSVVNEWQSGPRAHFLIVDEGPGLSGSSFAATAGRLAAIGISNDRIILLPSWEPDGTQFVSERARQQWPKHRRFTASFEQVWIDSGRLFAAWPRGNWRELSGGRWRDLFETDETNYPAVHPQHERRKFLWQSRDEPGLWLKFADPGRYGRKLQTRAEILAAAGFAPRVVGLKDGFLAFEFINGQPLSLAQARPLLRQSIAPYLAFRQRNFPAAAGCSEDELKEMIRLNVAEGLGEAWAARLPDLAAMPGTNQTALTAVDARMQPHEWLRAGGRLIKTDGLDHGDDHFLPGGQDIAWDLAGACVELMADRAEREALTSHYRRLTGDDATERLPFFMLANLAARLGYVTLAATTLDDSPEAARFTRLARRYAEQLRREICLCR